MIARLKQYLAAQKLDRITAANRARLASPEYRRRSAASKLGHQRKREGQGA